MSGVGDSNRFLPRYRRIPNADEKLRCVVDGESVCIENFSRFGLALRVGAAQTILRDAFDVSVRYGDAVIFEGHASVRHRRPHPVHKGETVIGVQLEKELASEPLEALLSVGGVTARIDRLVDEAGSIPQEVRKFVDDLILYFSTFQEFLKEQETYLQGLPRSERSRYGTALVFRSFEAFNARFASASQRFAQIVGGAPVPGDDARVRYLRRRMAAAFSDAELVCQAERTPVGYLGDTDVLELLGRQGFEGASLFGKVMNACLLKSAVLADMQARRIHFLGKLRAIAARAHVEDRTFRVLLVCAGEAKELQDFMVETDRDILARIDFVFADFSERCLLALGETFNTLQHRIGKPCERKFVLKASPSQYARPFEPFVVGLESNFSDTPFDLICVPFLGDYLDMSHARILMHKLSSMLAHRGTLVLARQGVLHPRRDFLHYLLDWEVRTIPQVDFEGLVPTQCACAVEAAAPESQVFVSIERRAA